MTWHRLDSESCEVLAEWLDLSSLSGKWGSSHVSLAYVESPEE